MKPRRTGTFFSRRWRGEIPMRTVFWRDMLGVGTAVNVLATFGALLAVGQAAPTWLALAIHFAPLPYNVFLFAAVGRALPRSRVAQLLALAWLVAMAVV
jgi:hypothetical protein